MATETWFAHVLQSNRIIPKVKVNSPFLVLKHKL